MISIIKAGIQTSVQDLGRSGYRHMGVCQSGALDSEALKLANSLVGNPINFAGLEIAGGPFEIACQSDMLIALSGADFSAMLLNNKLLLGNNMSLGANNSAQAIYPGWRCHVRAGQRLVLKGHAGGGRAYIAFRGGLDIDPVMGSCATDIATGFGGWQGRSLNNDDQLSIKNPAQLPALKFAQHEQHNIDIGTRPLLPEHTVRALPGNNMHYFSAAEQNRFWQSDWQISSSRNRMACRLKGCTLASQPATKLGQQSSASKLYSHAVIPGTVQVPADGQPIVLLADGQTTGGYPKIAQVIQADLWRLAQFSHTAMFRFVPCSEQEAIAALKQQQHHIYRLQRAVADVDKRKRQ